jgi:hypothetical protein
MNRSGGAGDGASDLHFLASPKTLGYSPKARLLVATTEVLVKARLIRLNRGCPPDWAKARVYAHWLYAACYDLAADSKQGPIDTQPASHQLVLSALQSIRWREMALDSDNGKD